MSQERPQHPLPGFARLSYHNFHCSCIVNPFSNNRLLLCSCIGYRQGISCIWKSQVGVVRRAFHEDMIQLEVGRWRRYVLEPAVPRIKRSLRPNEVRHTCCSFDQRVRTTKLLCQSTQVWFHCAVVESIAKGCRVLQTESVVAKCVLPGPPTL